MINQMGGVCHYAGGTRIWIFKNFSYKEDK